MNSSTKSGRWISEIFGVLWRLGLVFREPLLTDSGSLNGRSSWPETREEGTGHRREVRPRLIDDIQ